MEKSTNKYRLLLKVWRAYLFSLNCYQFWFDMSPFFAIIFLGGDYMIPDGRDELLSRCARILAVSSCDYM